MHKMLFGILFLNPADNITCKKKNYIKLESCKIEAFSLMFIIFATAVFLLTVIRKVYSTFGF